MQAITMEKIDYKKYWEEAINFDQYLKNFEEEMEPGNEGPYSKYLPQNYSRQARILRKYRMNESILADLEALSKKRRWLVITEHWCGDASQIIPIFQKAANESGGQIEVRYVYRDQNKDLIDAHLTDGRSRSIPIILDLDEEFEVIASYGPRPAEAQVLAKQLIARKEDYNLPLHSWYAKDKQKSLTCDLQQFITEKRK